ncbi:asc-type amino acid transporter 1 isoform X7 [Heterocephalus glaber]|uniref:Asc-type amino acid transporter 1 isoform X7 n=1 Tax=Heterocephalus glaber TaxID=10181 RepID=A0AAX6RC08_HETGA|nr:asc-type amino acid transporter 1 isoform X7 [Heterocephalus glaber]
MQTTPTRGGPFPRSTGKFFPGLPGVLSFLSRRDWGMGASPLRAVGEGRRPGLLPPPRPSLPGGRGPGPGASACARFGRCPDCVRGDRTDRLTDGRSRGRRDRRGSAGSGGTAGRQDDDGPLPAAERVQEPWPCSLAFPRPGPGPRRLGEGGAQERDRTRERLHHHHRFLLLWSAVLIMYPTSLAVISMTFSNYVLQPVFPNCIPPATASRALSMACLSGLPSLVLLTWVNSSSVRWATRIQDIFTGGKLLALSIIIGVGFVQIFQGHFEELRPSNAFAFWMTPSVGHLALAFLQGSFAFSGWNFLNYVTEELVDPRNRPPLLPVGTALERKMNADPVICIWPKLTHMHATWSLQLKPVTPSDAQPGVWTGNYCSQEPTSCHLHLYPSGDLCVHVHQCCLLHSHVPTGAAGLQRSGCDLRGEAAGLLFMGHACLRGTFHFWRDQWLPVHLFQAVLLWSPRGAPSQPAGHDPCQTLHPYPCPPRLSVSPRSSPSVGPQRSSCLWETHTHSSTTCPSSTTSATASPSWACWCCAGGGRHSTDPSR